MTAVFPDRIWSWQMGMHSNFKRVINNNSSSGVNLTPYSGVILGGSHFNSKMEFKELFFRSKNDLRYWGVKITPEKELSCTQNFYSTFKVKVTPKRVKTTHVRSKNNPIFRVILTPDWGLNSLNSLINRHSLFYDLLIYLIYYVV